MWTYIPEYIAYIKLLFAMYVRPFMKPKKPTVSRDTSEQENNDGNST